MLFNTIGDPASSKKGMLLHAMAVDSSQFDQICELLKEDYFLILPTFDGHYKDQKTEFTTLDEQVDQILSYLEKNNFKEFDFIAGVSLGALATFEIYKRNRITVRKYIFDGGPFFLLGPLRRTAMKFFFWTPLKLLKSHPNLAWIGEKKFGHLLTTIAVQVTSFLTKRDVYNIVDSLFRASIPEPLDKGSTRLVFLYGSRENAYRSFKRFRHLSGYELIVKEGYGHCRFLMENREVYADILRLT